MFPYKTSFIIQKSGGDPVYLQLAKQFIAYISEGTLVSKTKLPSSRQLSEWLVVHRKTIVACYEELELQGWVETVPKKGAYVKNNLPILRQKKYDVQGELNQNEIKAGFFFYKDALLSVKKSGVKVNTIFINDGISDVRLTPALEIGRLYRKIAAKKEVYRHLSYGTTYGNERLREVLVEYLNRTRGLGITKDNILITRGSQMGIWLSSQLLLRENDIIVVGETNYDAADITFLQKKAQIMRISVDEEGIVVDELRLICESHVIKAIYVTSHHHHPTTVTLSAKRRIELLNLARKYRFAIIEDDYDYDFNYNHAPILPLASYDVGKNVIYIGSVCKSVAPVFRIGYLIADKRFVDEASNMRRFVDRQGDAILELVFAEFIKSGDLDRHLRKVMKIYETRRNLMCKLLKEELSEVLSFTVPKGGMAIWVTLAKKYSWEAIATAALNNKLFIGNWKQYDMANKGHNAIRIGFASYNEEEIYSLVNKLKRSIEAIKK